MFKTVQTVMELNRVFQIREESSRNAEHLNQTRLREVEMSVNNLQEERGESTPPQKNTKCHLKIADTFSSS